MNRIVFTLSLVDGLQIVPGDPATVVFNNNVESLRMNADADTIRVCVDTLNMSNREELNETVLNKFQDEVVECKQRCRRAKEVLGGR